MDQVRDVTMTLVICMFSAMTIIGMGILMCTALGAGFRGVLWNIVKAMVSMATGIFPGCSG